MNCAFTEELKDEIYQKNYTEHEILQNAYNGKLDILLPVEDASEEAIRSITKIVQDLSFYEFSGSPALLLHPDLYSTFIHTGIATIVSSSDNDNKICISQGILSVTLDKDSYLVSGIDAKPSSSEPKDTLWVANIDLKSAFLRPQWKGFERLKAALGRLPGKWSFYLTFPTEKVDQSYQNNLSHSLPVPMISREINLKKGKLDQAKIPPPLVSTLNRNELFPSNGPLEVLEILSFLRCNAKCVQNSFVPDPYISRYKPSCAVTDVLYLSIKGLFSSSTCLELYELIRNISWNFIGVESFNSFRDVDNSSQLHSGDSSLLSFYDSRTERIRWTWRLS
ncbi:RNase P subunit [Schizosaccharomyces pombe]